MTVIPIKRALLSVSDKTNLIEFARELHRLNIEIISTGGTSEALKRADIPHLQVEEVTGFPEIFAGRVKTLHPKIQGGILGKRDQHAVEAQEHHIEWIDLVVVNFYPFAEAIANKNITPEKAVEYIDIGGPSMVRAAAKNYAWTLVMTSVHDYADILTELNEHQGITLETRKKFAAKAFAMTAQYDAMVRDYFNAEISYSTHPDILHLQFNKHSSLRYGENPHQAASAYHLVEEKTGLFAAKQHQGKPLSYNNFLDADAAINCVREFMKPACVIVKHANPCGVAVADTIDDAYSRAYQADPASAFGGVIALNQPCNAKIAEAINAHFFEVIIAPAYSEEALTLFAAKPNLRVLELDMKKHTPEEMRFITGGLLRQERNNHILTVNDLQIVTAIKPTSADIETLLFAWQVIKHVKSNGILIAKNNMTAGIGAGQVSRVDAVDIAVRKAAENICDSVLASDAFFPFRDSIDRMAGLGIRAIVQPGGSVRDAEVIAACNEHGIAMAFTGKRCFRH